MTTLAPQFVVTTHSQFKEVHYEAHGLWDGKTIVDLQKGLYKASKRYIEASEPFRVLGDLTDFPVQKREIADKMQLIQEASAQLGVERMALVINNMLVRQQFRRVSKAVNLELFDTRAEALNWLRAD